MKYMNPPKFYRNDYYCGMVHSTRQTKDKELIVTVTKYRKKEDIVIPMKNAKCNWANVPSPIDELDKILNSISVDPHRIYFWQWCYGPKLLVSSLDIEVKNGHFDGTKFYNELDDKEIKKYNKKK